MAYLRVVFKRFGPIEALKGIDLAIYQGEVVALLGPNGAGKTTAISLLLGVRRPDRGEARLFGHPPQLPQARCQIGATPQDTGFPGHLTVSEVVELVRGHYPQPLATTVILERFGLHDLAHRQTGGLSGGQRRRLAVALAFAGDPELIFLDEPTAGLDPIGAAAFDQLIKELRDALGLTVFIITHDLDTLYAICDRVAVLADKKVIAVGTIPELLALDHEWIQEYFRGPRGRAAEATLEQGADG